MAKDRIDRLEHTLPLFWVPVAALLGLSVRSGADSPILLDIGRIYTTRNPMAMDRIAVDTFLEKNRLRTLTDSGRPAQYLHLASDLGLGITDRSRIHLETATLPRFSRSAA